MLGLNNKLMLAVARNVLPARQAALSDAHKTTTVCRSLACLKRYLFAFLEADAV